MPTIKERIFNIVRENPGITHHELGIRLKDIAKGSLGSQMHDLINRNVIYAKQGTTVKRGRYLLGLHTDLDKYTLMPLQPAPVHPSAKPAPVEFNVQSVLDPLTLGQARKLYAELHKMFGRAV